MSDDSMYYVKSDQTECVSCDPYPSRSVRDNPESDLQQQH
jgi:hypothetical protein